MFMATSKHPTHMIGSRHYREMKRMVFGGRLVTWWVALVLTNGSGINATMSVKKRST